MATAFEPSISGQKVVRISPISEQVKRLGVITCDFCPGMASFDVYLEGVISEVNVLKRYCEECIKGVTPAGVSPQAS
ncbi:MAG TPA: hypothetical protein VJP79_01455 [Nitrososphaera sp.]|nr:hypothetical protein [Nitrososphaera sp.]